MANTSTTQALLSLDHATNKAALKTFLKNKPQFKDVDFEGSNINLLLDILAYNTFTNAFYTNMALAEGFLDSAQLRSSIVSHAKDLNYLPTSVKSAKTTAVCTFRSSGSGPYTIARGSPFTTLIKNKSFVFTVPKNIVVSSSNSTFTFTTDIYEGLYLSDVFLFDSVDDIQRFKLTNLNIDTTSISVTVFEDGSQFGDEYKVTDTLLGLEPDSKVFFVQATQDGYYEILFGDNIFGRQPKAQSLINVQYRVSQGEAANGGKIFSCDFDPTGVGELIADVTVTAAESASGGSPRQSNESIRSLAPRYFATQQRAVASDDYASLVLSKFSDDIDDVNVYGGETVEPKQYGRVIVALKPTSGTVSPDYVKSDISNMLLKFISIPTRVILADPDYFYAKINTTVQYDTSSTTKQPDEIKGLIQTAMTTFSEDTLEKFGKDFRYSRFVSAIDDADTSIVSNDTAVTIVKKITPKLLFKTSYKIAFNNRVNNENDVPALTSTAFTWVDLSSETYYENAYLEDDGEGKLCIYTYVGDNETMLTNDIGTIDYTTGLVTINDLLVADYDNHISIEVRPISKDILMNQGNIISIDLEDVTITLSEKLT